MKREKYMSLATNKTALDSTSKTILVCGAGGFIGAVSAAGLVLLIYKIGEMPVTYDPIFIIGPMVGSVLLGLLAGAYPAWQAAKIEVLDILRNE